MSNVVWIICGGEPHEGFMYLTVPLEDGGPAWSYNKRMAHRYSTASEAEPDCLALSQRGDPVWIKPERE